MLFLFKVVIKYKSRFCLKKLDFVLVNLNDASKPLFYSLHLQSNAIQLKITNDVFWSDVTWIYILPVAEAFLRVKFPLAQS